MRELVKKVGTFMISAAVVLSCVPSFVFAEGSAGLEDAIISAKSRIEVPAELSEFDSSVNTYDNGTQYSLNWSEEDGDSSMRVTVNDRNDIVYYNYYRNTDDEDKIQFASFSIEQLVDSAYEWLEKVNPGWISELPRENAEYSQISDIHSGWDNVTLYRYVNGIPFLNNYVSFSFNNRTGDIRNMRAEWSYETNIPNPNEAMSQDAAAEEYFKISPLELQYVSDGESTAKLLYTPISPRVKINARTGGELNKKIYSGSEANKEDATMAADMSSGGGVANRVELTESEIKNLEEIGSLISKAEIESKARSLYNTELDKAEFTAFEYRRSYKYVPAPYNEGKAEEKESYAADISFVINKDTENQINGNVLFDAETGELLSYYSWSDSDYRGANEEGKKPVLSVADGEQIAKAFAEQNAAEQINKTKVAEMPEEVYGKDYYFSFIRHENDIPFSENSLVINVDSETGRIVSFGKTWTDEITFEDPSGVLDVEGAKAAFCENIGFELLYDYDYIEADKKSVVELAYAADGEYGYSINAKTGERKTDGYEEGITAYPDDIAGHYAENQIKALIDTKVLEIADETAFRPDDAITHGELALMVGKLINAYYGPKNKAEIVSMAQNIGIILKEEDFDSDVEATRVYGPKYIIRALGYREAAELEGIYTCDFADINEIPGDMLGYVALAKGFGIIGGDENRRFNANDILTRADAAIMIYNYLAR